MKVLAIGLGLIVSLDAGAQAIDNPWSLVPALPSACYGEQDDFSELVDEGFTTVTVATDSQRVLNEEANAQLGDIADADPFAMAQRMQEYMMQNPEAAMKMMEDLYATGQTISDDIIAEGERERQLISVLDDLIARYNDEFAAMLAPIAALVAALPTHVVGEGFDAYTAEAIAQLPAINRQASAAYEKLCAGWWKSTPFKAPLAEYRAFLTDEKIPHELEMFAQAKQQLDIQGVDTAAYQPIGAMDATRDYLKQLQRIFVLRVEQPTDLHTLAE
jgi:hypothetical protein